MEGFQHLVERARFIASGDHDRGAVAATPRHCLIAHDEEARLVVWLVLDVAMDDIEAVAIRGGFAGDGRHVRAFGGDAGGLGVARHRASWQRGEVCVQPMPTLRQGLFVGAYLAQLRDLGIALDEERMVDR